MHLAHYITPPNPLPFQITERDVAVMDALRTYRMLDRAQIEKRFFTPSHGRPTNQAQALKRLKKLYDYGFVERIMRKGWWGMPTPSPAYRLAKRGAELLANRGSDGQLVYWGMGDDKDWHPTRVGHSFIDHMLSLAQIRMTVEKAAQASGCSIEAWLDEVALKPTWKTERVTIKLQKRSVAEEVAVTPDGYFVMTTRQGRGHFFIEVDRGTETIYRAWQKKILTYAEYWRSGKFAKRYSPTHAEASFRVLCITTSDKRAMNIIKAAQQYAPDAAGLFLSAPVGRVDESLLTAAIWQRGGHTAAQALI